MKNSGKYLTPGMQMMLTITIFPLAGVNSLSLTTTYKELLIKKKKNRTQKNRNLIKEREQPEDENRAAPNFFTLEKTTRLRVARSWVAVKSPVCFLS